MKFIQKYKKVLVNLIGVIISAVLAAYMGDGAVDTTELANIIILAAGTLSVGIASNTLAAKYTKGLLAGIAGTATLVFSLATGGITTTEWAQIGVAFAAAAGVFQAKNKGDNLDKEVVNC